jgi:hypothetical protein
MANLSIRWPKNKRFAAMVETIEFEWQSFFRRVGERVSALESYTVATLPSAADNPRMMIYVSDAAGSPCMAFSDGTNWKRCDDASVTVT